MASKPDLKGSAAMGLVSGFGKAAGCVFGLAPRIARAFDTMSFSGVMPYTPIQTVRSVRSVRNPYLARVFFTFGSVREVSGLTLLKMRLCKANYALMTLLTLLTHF